MTTFLLIVSFILNVIALLSIVLLFMRQNRLASLEKKQEKNLQDLEEVISTFMLQMKEENDLFLEKIKTVEIVKGAEARQEKKLQPITQNPLEGKELTPKLPSYRGLQVYKSVQKDETMEQEKEQNNELESLLPPLKELEEANQEATPKTLLEQIQELKETGLSTKEIAKKLDKGQTEIELLLKFKQNSE